jgi:hypothetical protein
MKHTLSELKKMVKEHKKSVPMLSSGKNTLFAYALKHQLIEADKHLHSEAEHEKLSKKERDLAETGIRNVVNKLDSKVEMPKAAPKPRAMKKVEQVTMPKDVPKPKVVHNLKEVQALRKEKGVSLKDAWAMYLNKQKKT